MNATAPQGKVPQTGAEESKIRLWLAAGAFLTLPSAFLYFSNRMAFEEAYILYWRVVQVVAVAIIALSMIIGIAAAALKKRLPKLFEAPPVIPDWSAGVAAGFAFLTAIVFGAAWGAETGFCVFWPSAFLAMTIAHITNWVVHQAKRWWE